LFPAAIHRIEACCFLVTKTPERFAIGSGERCASHDME